MAEIDWDRRMREAIASFNSGDYEEIAKFVTADVELRRADNAPEARGVVSGREAVVGFFRPQAFTDQNLELVKIEGDPPAMVGHIVFRARGAGSGLPVEIESWTVYRIEGELVSGMEVFASEEEARSAAARLRASPAER